MKAKIICEYERKEIPTNEQNSYQRLNQSGMLGEYYESSYISGWKAQYNI